MENGNWRMELKDGNWNCTTGSPYVAESPHMSNDTVRLRDGCDSACGGCMTSRRAYVRRLCAQDLE